MKKILEYLDGESGLTETTILVIIFLLILGSLVIAGLRMD